MYKQNTYYIHEEIKNIFDNNEQPMPRFVLTSRTWIRFVAKTWQKKTALTRLCALFIYQCARAAEAHISWWGQKKKVKNTLRYFWRVLSKTINIFEVPVFCFLQIFCQMEQAPLSPHLFRHPLCEKPNQITSVYGIYFLCESEITIIEQELPTLS